MTGPGVLVANRGEIAVRIMRTATEVGLRTVAVFSEDDAGAWHTAIADEARPLTGRDPAAYLDTDQLVRIAVDSGCTLVHPGYGFLSESAAFARRCAESSLVFVGPSPDVLEVFGDKAAARRLAVEQGLPVPAGTSGASPDEAAALLASLGSGGAIVVKPRRGGGGRGLRIVTDAADVEAAFASCRAEARTATGERRAEERTAADDCYVEQLLPGVRHIEVQVLGDGSAVVTLGDRDCSVQRRHQKLIELAPAPGLDDTLRRRLADAAQRLTAAVGYRGLGTVEFLVRAGGAQDRKGDGPGFFFLEVNTRLQVEHPVTEEVLGRDLVAAGLQVALGATLADLRLDPDAPPQPRGVALQLRVNAETMRPDGSVAAADGALTAFAAPTGPGVRTDTAAATGWRANPRFDSLLAKVIVSTEGTELPVLAAKAARALTDLRVDGVATNAGFLAAVLDDPDFVAGRITTDFVDTHAAELVAAAHARAHDGADEPAPAPEAIYTAPAPPAGTVAVAAPTAGVVTAVHADPGDPVAPGAPLVVVEAMKMEHVVAAQRAGVVHSVTAQVGATVAEGAPLVFVVPRDAADDEALDPAAVDLDDIRPDLAELQRRQVLLTDAARRDAVARRHARGRRTARENVADLIDEGSFVEYGGLVVAAQRARRPLDELLATTPADGLVAGTATVGAALFGDRASCAVLSYDALVLAGTQGANGHVKTDRLLDVVARQRLPVVFFAEGGGGRPGDTDHPVASGLHVRSFAAWGRLSGLVPRIAVVSGRCFAGNAAIAGMADVVIATADTTLGMGGPAMIEGGGLGLFPPEDIGPLAMHVGNGVVDVAVDDDAAAVRAATTVLSYFQGALPSWEHADQRVLRHAVPADRKRAYDVRRVVDALADTGTVTELRPGFAPGMVTALARVEGRPVGILANNPLHLAGAITSDGADKAARFLQLCDAFDLPVVTLVDTPGMMVGPAAEQTALVRHCSRLFVVGANLSVPVVALVLRKGYGLGAQAMMAGSTREPLLVAAWPTGELGPMGLEGAVRLGFRRELDAITDPQRRAARYDELVAALYEQGAALSVATYGEIDAVIDPAQSRRVVAATLRAPSASGPARNGKKLPWVDTW